MHAMQRSGRRTGGGGSDATGHTAGLESDASFPSGSIAVICGTEVGGGGAAELNETGGWGGCPVAHQAVATTRGAQRRASSEEHGQRRVAARPPQSAVGARPKPGCPPWCTLETFAQAPLPCIRRPLGSCAPAVAALRDRGEQRRRDGAGDSFSKRREASREPA